MSDPTESDLAKARRVSLANCPCGLFLFDGFLGFKSEYKTQSMSHPGYWQVDAYVVESGEYFWGGESDPRKRDKLLVEPLPVDVLAQARAEGWRQMWEDAARIAHREMNRYADNALDDWAMRCAQAASDIEDAIRSLPDHPETSAPVKED